MLAVAFLLFGGMVQAQKFGYVNSAAIISEMDEMKQLESSLKALQAQLKKKGEAEVAAYQKEEQDAIQKKQRGELTPKQEETIMTNLQKKQEEIYKMGADMEKQLADKQQEGMKPILERVNEAIQAVASEGEFQYIFDAQSGVILYADESTDVTSLVKAKLNM